MPIYEYECKKCGHLTEAWQKFTEPPLSECEMCHGKLLPRSRPTKEQCLECHGSYQELGMITEKEESLNPHQSHIGEVRCTYCHHAHKESKDYCNRCHDEIKFEVP